MTVGERIKYLREQAGMTQPELAEKIGVKFPAISKYETGTVDNLPLKKIQALADALGVTGAQLLGWDAIPVTGYVYDEKDKQIKAKRMELHQMIDEAPEGQIKLLEILLKLSPQRLEALAILTAQSRDEPML